MTTSDSFCVTLNKNEPTTRKIKFLFNSSNNIIELLSIRMMMTNITNIYRFTFGRCILTFQAVFLFNLTRLNQIKLNQSKVNKIK